MKFPFSSAKVRLVPLLAIALRGLSLGAQTDPSLHWRTIITPHFQVSFSPGLDETAKRAAGSAERAYFNLKKELAEPRTPISIVVADNFDISNGFATPNPRNRIVIYARPAIDAGSLKFNDDWVDLVVVHELTHIFHLDRAGGLWGFGQKIFGRNPFLFPNAYTPSWLAEGIAVYYESKLTGGGRLVGTDFDALARAHDIGATVPRLNGLSAASPNYPLGNIAYSFGAPLIEQMAMKGKADGMRAYIDGTGRWLLPFMLNTNAKRAFGFSFDSMYKAFTDSVHTSTVNLQPSIVNHQPLVTGGWFSSHPRWVDDTTIVWASQDAKSVPSLKRVNTKTGAVSVVTELHTTDTHSLLPNGVRVFAQDESLDPYTQRSDLWIDRGGSSRRLTVGERITHPDARMCGDSPDSTDICVVAVRVTPGGAQLVTIRIYGEDKVDIRPISEPSSAEIYSEPRWSRDGRRIAATRWSRGGVSRIDVLDAGGMIVGFSVGASRSVTSSPSWGPGDSTIYFTSDRTGSSAIYRASISTGLVLLIAYSPTGYFENEPSPDGRKLATFQLGNDGYNLTVLDAAPGGVLRLATDASIQGRSRNIPVAISDYPAEGYSAWRSVLPAYWMPALGGEGDDWQYGFSTSGSDVIGRHDWSLRTLYDFDRSEPTISADYAFSGLGVPVLRVAGNEFWDHFILGDSTGKAIGKLNRRRVVADFAAVFSRPRFRRSSLLSIGGSYEWRADETEPPQLINGLDPAFRMLRTYPSFFASASFGTTRQPILALGPEDGISVGATVRTRWRNGAEASTRSTSYSGIVQAYRGFDFGARAHHLLAVRVAAATTDITAPTEFSAGGNSGGVIQVAPGVTFGDGRRSYFVRGFDGATQSGNMALGMSAEYRFPIAFPARGFWKTPLFLQRISGAVFTDAARAWCSSGANTSAICPRVTDPDFMTSVGAELHFDTALQYDFPYKFRVGFAQPTGGRQYAKSSSSFYLTVGLPF
jgi:hypothetical protein